MGRKTLQVYQHTNLRIMAAICCMLFFLPDVAFAAAETNDRLHRLLKNDMAFTAKEFNRFKAGETVTKILETDTQHEVGIFSIAKINVSKELFIRRYQEKGMNLETAAANSWGIIKIPPQIEDLTNITLPKEDIADLKTCTPGNCKVKAPLEAINNINQLDANAPDFEESANQLLQLDTVDYLNRYLKGGNRMLVEYSDKKKPVRLTEQFQGLLKASSYLQRYVPELYAYLEEFPNSQLAHAEDIFIWLKEDFNNKKMRPNLSINHMVLYRPQGSDGNPIVALKQLYASHYFEASLGLTVVFEDSQGNGTSLYVINVNRVRVDVLRTIPGFLAGKLFKGARNLMHQKMSAVTQNMEKSN